MEHRSPYSASLMAAASLLSITVAAPAQEQNPSSRVLGAHEGSITSVAFSRDGKVLVSGSRDDLIHVWEVANGERKKCGKKRATSTPSPSPTTAS